MINLKLYDKKDYFLVLKSNLKLTIYFDDKCYCFSERELEVFINFLFSYSPNKIKLSIVYNFFDSKISKDIINNLLIIFAKLNIINLLEEHNKSSILLVNIDWKNKLVDELDKENSLDGYIINHITFSVNDLNKSISFYEKVFDIKLVAQSNTLAYFNMRGLWLALNLEEGLERNEVYKSYTHISFSIENIEQLISKFEKLKIEFTHGRTRNVLEGTSIYLRDPDGHLLEFHTKELKDRLEYYRKHRVDIKVHD